MTSEITRKRTKKNKKGYMLSTLSDKEDVKRHEAIYRIILRDFRKFYSQSFNALTKFNLKSRFKNSQFY